MSIQSTVHELALFRKLQGGRASYFITISRRLLPDTDTVTLTIVRWGKEPKYEHVVKKIGRAAIHGSAKISINKEIIEDLGLSKGSVVWVRILPFMEKPPGPPKIPYIAKPVKVHTDKSSLFFTISKTQIDYIRETGLASGDNLHIYVTTPAGTVIDYIKKPILVKRDNIYKVILPMKLFYGLIHVHDTIHVKIMVTEKPESLFYTE